MHFNYYFADIHECATRMLSVTTLKAPTIVHANQDILEMALIAQVNIVTKILIAKTLT